MFCDFPPVPPQKKHPKHLDQQKHQKPEAPSRPVLVMRWESEEETERWFHHLEAAVRTPALSVREMLKDMALSTLVMVKIYHGRSTNPTLKYPPKKIEVFLRPC